jgi:hypothetical protein
MCPIRWSNFHISISEALGRKTKVIPMTDLLYLGLVLLFFGASWGFIVGCEKLREE